MAGVNTDVDFPPLPTRSTTRRASKSKSVASVQYSRSTGPIATLDDLPDELILGILEYLPGIDPKDFQLQTLLSLSLTTRHLHRVVSDKIYAVYDSYFCEPYLFLRTLISNPQLAQSVRHAKFRYGDDAHLERKRYSPTARDKKIIKEGMRGLDFPDWKGWAARCNVDEVEFDILHTAVLLYTPNLASLDVEDGQISAYSKAKWPELIKKATTGEHFGHAHRFSSLKSVHLDAQNMVIRHLVPLLRLQSLRKLELRELSEIELDMRAPAELRRVLPERCNNLEELILEECSLRFDALTTLISSARKLKSFRFDVNQESVLLDGSGVMLQNCLWRQKDCLERLDIYHDPRHNDDDDDPLSHGGLEQFPALRNLKCPLRMVADVRSGASAIILEYLPPALESLTLAIRWGAQEEQFLPVLERMASDYSTAIPHLKSVTLNVQVPAEELDYDWERLVKAYSTTSVDLKINLPSESDDEWGDWRTVSSDSDDSSEDSDEVELWSNDSDDEESD